MDNISHTLIGVAVARIAGRKEPEKGVRSALLWTSVVGNNLPDLDFLYRFLGGSGQEAKLYYLLHHRGWTHSILAAVPLGVFAAVLGAIFARSKVSRGGTLLGVVSVLLHLFADFWNEYGIHPFFPLSERWFFGDFVFILEPLVWLTLVPIALGGEFRKGLKSLWWIPAFGIFGLLCFGPYVSFTVTVSLFFWFAAQFFVQWKWRRPWLGVASLVGALSLFFGMSLSAKGQIRSQLIRENPDFERELKSLLVSPNPGNPFCWRVLVSTVIAGDWVTNLGVFSHFPLWVDPKSCFFRGTADPAKMTAPVQPTLLPSGEKLVWSVEFRGSLGELKELRSKNSAFDRFIGFARFPYWKKAGNGATLIFGDLRFDRELELGFAEFEFPIETRIGEALPRLIGAIDEIR